ncbi:MULTISPECIES: hypothetical protein [unclassified Streptomyces]|uniref:hypothetical protein n=1 Tax=unclassified Streptomyces TaxID=2593676 RepID=UPI0035DD6D41
MTIEGAHTPAHTTTDTPAHTTAHPSARTAEHGAGLTRRVIEHVRQDPGASALDYRDVPWVSGAAPRPLPEDVLARTVFPSGRPLSPSLRAWLRFDTTLLERHGWFAPEGGGALTPRPLDRLVGDEFGAWWTEDFAPLAERFPECFLLPGGSDSRRVLAVTEPDEEGEYPVLALDMDDLPFVGLMYPGFDVYLADTAGLVARDPGSYTSLFRHDTYGPRMRRHAAHCLDGEVCAQYPF